MTERAALSAALAGFPGRLALAARSAAGRPVPDGEWTPEQVVRHLIAVETDVHQSRLHDLETVADPRWDWTEPGPWTGEPGLDLGALLARFGSLRKGTLDSLAGLDDAGWARTGTHARLGVWDVAGLVRNAIDPHARLGVWDVAGLVRNAIDHDESHLAGLTG